MRKRTKPSNKYFWITNISKKIVNISDLGVIIYPLHSLNLLDQAHYPYLSEEKIIKSATSGSLFERNKLVVIRKVPPPNTPKNQILLDISATLNKPKRSTIKVEDITYDELIIQDDEFAEANADTAEEDRLGKWKS